jgi:hypothetical protein
MLRVHKIRAASPRSVVVKVFIDAFSLTPLRGERICRALSVEYCVAVERADLSRAWQSRAKRRRQAGEQNLLANSGNSRPS